MKPDLTTHEKKVLKRVKALIVRANNLYNELPHEVQDEVNDVHTDGEGITYMLGRLEHNLGDVI